MQDTIDVQMSSTGIDGLPEKWLGLPPGLDCDQQVDEALTKEIKESLGMFTAVDSADAPPGLVHPKLESAKEKSNKIPKMPQEDAPKMSQEDALKAARKASRAAAFALQSAWYDYDRYMMPWWNQMAQHEMGPMHYPPYYGYSMQDQHSYGWGMQQVPWCSTEAKVNRVPSSKTERKAREEEDDDGKPRSFGTDSTASGTGTYADSSPASWGGSVDDDSWDRLTTPQERTTVMMRNLPNNFTRQLLIELMDAEGYAGRYNFVYLPIDLKTMVGLGYAFIDLVSHEDALSFSSHFHLTQKWTMKSDKICVVNWSDSLQGLEEHVERYRNSPVMHEEVPDECKPVLFKNGERIDFPEPTKRLRAPRPWTRRQ